MPPLACSVIIPARDCLAYLPQALGSVWAQGRADLEILVVDDGSIDGTGEWLATRELCDLSLRVLFGKGRGPGEARNLALAAARAPLVAFLDADDVWRPGKLEAQIAFHRRHPEVVLSFTDYLHVDPSGGQHGTCFDFWPSFHRRVARTFPGAGGYRLLPDAASALLAENIVGTSTVMARRSALQIANGFANDLGSAEDWDLWLRLSRLGFIGFSDAVTTDYLMRPGSASGNVDARLEAMAEIMRRHRATGPVAPWAQRLAEARLLTGKAERARGQGRPAAALVRHALALMYAPSMRGMRAVTADMMQSLGLHR